MNKSNKYKQAPKRGAGTKQPKKLITLPKTPKVNPIKKGIEKGADWDK